MSGVFLIVTDWNYEHSPVLRPTTGGYPHITLFYSGKFLNSSELAPLASDALEQVMEEKINRCVLKAEDAKLNSFFHERSGKQRYDVLLHLSPADAANIDRLRNRVKQNLPVSLHEKLSMGPPHVTHSIHWTEAEALTSLEEVKKHLPQEVHITGVTID